MTRSFCQKSRNIFDFLIETAKGLPNRVQKDSEIMIIKEPDVKIGDESSRAKKGVDLEGSTPFRSPRREA